MARLRHKIGNAHVGVVSGSQASVEDELWIKLMREARKAGKKRLRELQAHPDRAAELLSQGKLRPDSADQEWIAKGTRVESPFVI